MGTTTDSVSMRPPCQVAIGPWSNSFITRRLRRVWSATAPRRRQASKLLREFGVSSELLRESGLAALSPGEKGWLLMPVSVVQLTDVPFLPKQSLDARIDI